MQKPGRIFKFELVLLILFLLAACAQDSDMPLPTLSSQVHLPALPEITTAPSKSNSPPAEMHSPTELSPTRTLLTTPTALFITDAYKVLTSYPHDNGAFTEGLYYEDGFLYESTGLYGHSTLRKVELESGKVVQEIALPDILFGEGLAVVGDKIYQLTWRAKVGFVYDKSTFQQIGEFHYPTEGWGLTYDGSYLVMSDGTSTIHFLDPQDFSVVKTINVSFEGKPVAKINELEYIQGEIFANIFATTFIDRIDPVSGQVIEQIDFKNLIPLLENTQPIDVLNGIAYDPGSDWLFVTGKLWPKVFEIELQTR
jgi:glutamine cyclotransferase